MGGTLRKLPPQRKAAIEQVFGAETEVEGGSTGGNLWGGGETTNKSATYQAGVVNPVSTLERGEKVCEGGDKV